MDDSVSGPSASPTAMSSLRDQARAGLDPSGFQRLAEACENADGPDRRLGAEIEVAARGFPERAYQQKSGMRPKGLPELDRMEWAAEWFGPGLTASVDAAMTLIPEGHDFGLGSGVEDAPDGDNSRCWAWVGIGHGPYAFARTPALALCAAALRAKADPIK